MIVYFFIGALLAVVSDMIKTARKNKPQELPPTQYHYTPEPVVVEYAPIVEPEENPAAVLARADVDRYEAIKGVYIDVLDALEEEVQAIQAELDSPETTDKRRTTLAHRMATVKGKIATTTNKLYSLDRKIEMAFQEAAA